MNQSILVIRILIVLFCAAGAFTASYLFPDILDSTGVAVLVGILLGVGYLDDGSMVVVNHSADLIGTNVLAEIESIIPTSGGRMVFGKLLGKDK
jgi:hypothetical protein